MSKTIKPYAANSIGVSCRKIAAVIIASLLLLLGAYLLFSQTYLANREVGEHGFAAESDSKDKPTSETRPIFVDLGTFTANLSGEGGGQNLQTSISLKLTQPGLDERIKTSIPEIMHHVNMVLQSKRSSELTTYEGKEILAQQIKEHVEYVMGFRKTAPIIGAMQIDAAPTIKKNGISEVLFTSFIIQY